ncbi:S-type pyocin domain-containing protein [Pseudomonas fluorescens]|uniref:S-type pyocin domain-containing protein n=1 Tax=Pseudomonas fluorescens TaxID=294 RepID=UPI001BE8F83F|nr:S-type pyocin domain-containing protein [Pseudomonas fluorescens]MBT2373678.1 S-type pyocin domain-containing protein [Pseudomonas fluorescens]
MPERAYPITEKEQLRRRILTPQPSRAPHPLVIDVPDTIPAPTPEPAKVPGYVFAKSCQLPNGIISYNNPTGYVSLELIKDYGHFTLLGGREVDSRGDVSLKKISGSALPVGLGQLVLRTAALESAAAAVGAAAGGLLTGLVALAWPSELGDSALYSEDQLRNLQQARSQMRLHVEQSADGTLKGYGFYTGKNADWQMIDVVQFQSHDSQFVADLGEGVKLIWTPAVDPGDTLGIPALEAAPQAPLMWIYPPTEAAKQILVNPIYPPEYRDFILVFPVESGVRPLYVVVSQPRKGLRNRDHDYFPAPKTEDITGFPGLIEQRPVTPRQGGGGLRERWIDAKGRKLYEWDSKKGELEAYRNSDLSHLGAFDPYTGERRGPAKPERRIYR